MISIHGEREREREREKRLLLVLMKLEESSEEEGLWIRLAGSDREEGLLSGVVPNGLINGLPPHSSENCSLMMMSSLISHLSIADLQLKNEHKKKGYLKAGQWVKPPLSTSVSNPYLYPTAPTTKQIHRHEYSKIWFYIL